MFAEIFARNVMELNLPPSTMTRDANMTPLEKLMENQKFGADLRGEIRSLSHQMNCTQSKTVEMCLRMHFNLPVPDGWRKDSWRVSQVDIIRE